MEDGSDALIVFVKNSIPGTVKTRLAQAVGHEKALEIYGRLVDYTASVARDSGVPVATLYSDYVPCEDQWTHIAGRRGVQSQGDLGQRMYHAFKEFCEDHDKVVLIGSDCGELTAAGLREAFSALNDTQIVVGPSRDGGYYLIGMRQPSSKLFEGIAWSTETVFSSTIRRILELGCNFTVLEELNDVDKIEDWNELRW